jgi:hypothetical protein
MRRTDPLALDPLGPIATSAFDDNFSTGGPLELDPLSPIAGSSEHRFDDSLSQPTTTDPEAKA